MKRAQYLGSAGMLSLTQILILVLFLGSYTDVVKGASIAPTPSLSTSGTASMSVSLSSSVTQSTSASASVSLSTSSSAAATLTSSSSLSFLSSPSNSASFVAASQTGSLSPLFTGSGPITYYGQFAFPADVPKAVVNEYFCGNGYKDTNLGEECDYGQNATTALSCCTDKCKFAKAGKACEKRPDSCYKKGTCSNHGTCEAPEPKSFGAKCTTVDGVKGTCNNVAKCVPADNKKGQKKGGAAKKKFNKIAKRGAKHVKDVLKKRNLKIRQKHKDFNLDEIETQTKFNNDLSSDKKLKRDQDIVDEIFDEDAISEEENVDEDTDDQDQEDLDDQESD